MATKSIVPRADGEGGIGTAAKNWDTSYIETMYTDHIEEITSAHGVVCDGVQLKDGGALAITGGTNTFNITNGTASLDVAAGATVNVDANLTVGSAITLPNVTAGGIPYGSAANVLSDLAKGAANLKMFMNAGATAPEWASGSKLITFTRDLAAATGNVAYTGVGFKPSVVIMFATVGGTAITSWGFQVGTTRYVLYRYNATLDQMSVSFLVAAIVNMYTDYVVGIINTYDSDGFTMTWTKEAGSPTGTLTCLCLCLR